MNRSNSDSLLREHFIYNIILAWFKLAYTCTKRWKWIVKMGRNTLETCRHITRNVLLHFPRANNSIRSQENWIRALYLWQGQSQSTPSAAFATFPWSFRGRIRGIAGIEPLIKARDCRTSIRTLIRGGGEGGGPRGWAREKVPHHPTGYRMMRSRVPPTVAPDNRGRPNGPRARPHQESRPPALSRHGPGRPYPPGSRVPSESSKTTIVTTG